MRLALARSLDELLVIWNAPGARSEQTVPLRIYGYADPWRQK